MGAIGVSGGYGEYAAREGKAANVWRWVAAVSLIAAGAIASWFLLEVPEEMLTWQRIVTRALIAAPFAALAAYAASQSGRHRENERYARKAELELAALDPYLSLFPEPEKNDIKGKLADRMFGQPLPVDLSKIDSVDVAQLLTIVEKLVEALRGQAR